MERNIKIRAIVLKRIQIGESNLGVTLLTERDEILFVMAFGAAKPKSRLFEGVSPFVLSLWNLYFDPVKEYWRAKDLSLIEDNGFLHGDLKGFYLVSFFSEVILKCQGAQGVFNLLNYSLKQMGSDRYNYLYIQFLFRFLYEQGLLQDFTSCSSCSREGATLYMNRSGDLICPGCLKGERAEEFNLGIINYLRRSLEIDLGESLKIGIGEKSLDILKRYLTILIRREAGGKLISLETLEAIL